MTWINYADGKTIGNTGTGEGTIIQDVEYPQTARITMEKDSSKAPFAITCNIYGWTAHTRTFKTLDAAKMSFDDMRSEIEKIAPKLTSTESRTNYDAALIAIGGFVKRFSA